MTLRKWLLLSALVLMVVIVAAFAVVYVGMRSAGVSSTGAKVIEDAKAARSFTGVDVVTGETVSLADYQGSVVLLNFVNYGCSQSTSKVVLRQLGVIQDLKRERTDFVPISVFCGCCSPDVLRDFAKKKGFDWPWILDSQDSIKAGYQQYVSQYGYPTLVVIGPDQGLRQVSGYADASTLSGMIDSALKD